MKTSARERLRAQARPIVAALPPRAKQTLRRVARGEPRPGSRRAEAQAAAKALARAERQRDRAQRRVVRLTEQLRVERQRGRVARQQASTNALRWARAYQYLLAAVRQTPYASLGTPQPEAPLSADLMPDRRAAQRLVGASLLADRLAAGAPLEDAVAATVRALVAAGDNAGARAMSQALQQQPATRTAGCLGSAIGAALLGWPELAWASFAEIPPAVWRRCAADEFLRAGLLVDAGATMDEARRLLDDRPADVPPAGWLAAARRTLVAGERELARGLYAVASDLAETNRLGEDDAEELAWLGRWLRDVPAAQAPKEGHVSFAVLDYKLPERAQASTNIGDHVQTIAALGHLVRHQGLRFGGQDPALAAVVSELQERVLPEARIASAGREVDLVTVQRDASTLDDVPPGTWAIWFGWHMKEMSDGFDFPLHPHLRPIIVSFHCKHIQMLTPAAIEYLRAHGPIGCRDWSTVDILLGAGVPAFFSGCITTTVNTVFPELGAEDRPGPDAPAVYVEVRDRPGGVATLTHAYPEVKHAPLDVNIRRALDQLDVYRREFSQVITSRLHCYLPSRSLGVDAEFRPFHAGDLRYEGLVGLDDDEFAEMRARMMENLEVVTTAIVEGRDEAEVYDIWRSVCSADVAAAERRREAIAPMPEPWFDVRAACRVVREGATTIERRGAAPEGVEVHVAFALDQNLTEQLHVAVAGLVDNASRPLHLWILSRGHDRAVFESFAATFPEVTATWLPCDSIDYGAVGGLLGHTTPSTMDRLLLPELLDDLARVVYIDIDTLPLGDIAQLFDRDLAGAAIAARPGVGNRSVTSGFAVVLGIATRLKDRPDASHDLVQRMCARFPYDFVAFNAGIMVLDLARMRADDFCREFLPYVDRYGMNDQDVLNCYAGPHADLLPASWNAQPSKELVSDPDIIHWTGRTKPWSQQYVMLQELWEDQRERLRLRLRRAE